MTNPSPQNIKENIPEISHLYGLNCTSFLEGRVELTSPTPFHAEHKPSLHSACLGYSSWVTQDCVYQNNYCSVLALVFKWPLIYFPMVSKYENSDANKDKSQCALQEVEVCNFTKKRYEIR